MTADNAGALQTDKSPAMRTWRPPCLSRTARPDHASTEGQDRAQRIADKVVCIYAQRCGCGGHGRMRVAPWQVWEVAQ